MGSAASSWGCDWGFDFDGNWHFSFFSKLEARPLSDLWPDGEGRFQISEDSWRCQTGPIEYTDMVRQAQEEIRKGEIYQVNLARFLHRDVEGLDPWEFFDGYGGRGGTTQFLLSDGRKVVGRSIDGAFLGVEGRE